MKVKYLENRNEVIDTTISIVQSATSNCIGMGRQIAWIEIPEFRAALKAAIERHVTVRVVGVEEGEVHHFAKHFEEINIPVRYYEHGDVRIALSDSRRGVLAFPLPCIGLHTNRAYNGLYIEDTRFVEWLEKRFDEIWDVAVPPKHNIFDRVRDDFVKNPATIISGLIGAALGAIATILAVYLAK